MSTQQSVLHRVGIIGLGVMGRSMLWAMDAHPAFQVIGAYDPAPTEERVARLFTSAEDLAADPDVDLVYVASPPAHHLAGVTLAAATRKPVLSEKPLAASVEEARRCVSLVEQAKIPSAVNFYLAASDAGVRMRRLVLGGRLGRVETAQLTLKFKEWPRPWQRSAGAWLAGREEGGFTREVASHFLFQMYRMFGPGRIEMSQLRRGSLGTETTLQARIVYHDFALDIDAAIAGDLDDHNRLTICGAIGQAAIVDWDRLEYDGAEADAPVPATFMLDSLALMLSGKPHELATFAEAAEVVALTESLIAGAGDAVGSNQ